MCTTMGCSTLPCPKGAGLPCALPDSPSALPSVFDSSPMVGAPPKASVRLMGVIGCPGIVAGTAGGGDSAVATMVGPKSGTLASTGPFALGTASVVCAGLVGGCAGACVAALVASAAFSAPG